VERASIRSYKFGFFKKSDLRLCGSHACHIAYNRYGVIGVSLEYQLRTHMLERVEDRMGAFSPVRAAILQQTVELGAHLSDLRVDVAATEISLAPKSKEAKKIIQKESQNYWLFPNYQATHHALNPALLFLEHLNRHCYFASRANKFRQVYHTGYPMRALILRNRQIFAKVGFERAYEPY